MNQKPNIYHLHGLRTMYPKHVLCWFLCANNSQLICNLHDTQMQRLPNMYALRIHDLPRYIHYNVNSHLYPTKHLYSRILSNKTLHLQLRSLKLRSRFLDKFEGNWAWQGRISKSRWYEQYGWLQNGFFASRVYNLVKTSSVENFKHGWKKWHGWPTFFC